MIQQLMQMKVGDLRKHAKSSKINLRGATKKEDIVKAIHQHESSKHMKKKTEKDYKRKSPTNFASSKTSEKPNNKPKPKPKPKPKQNQNQNQNQNQKLSPKNSKNAKNAPNTKTAKKGVGGGIAMSCSKGRDLCEEILDLTFEVWGLFNSFEILKKFLDGYKEAHKDLVKKVCKFEALKKNSMHDTLDFSMTLDYRELVEHVDSALKAYIEQVEFIIDNYTEFIEETAMQRDFRARLEKLQWENIEKRLQDLLACEA